MSRDVVLLSTADWDNPFWTNKQHVALELARKGNRVLYIESLGLRRPSVKSRDIKRIAKRLVKAIRPPKKVRENLWVWSPIVLPWHQYALVRRLNRLLLGGGLGFWQRWLRMHREWLWTYNPLTAEFFELNSFSCRIYHCVDEIKAQPGMPVEALEAAEEALTRQVDIVFATSPQLTETRSAWNSNTHYLPNVADYEHFSAALDPDTVVPADLAAVPTPRLGFIGAISGYKIDFDLLRAIAEARPDWSIVLIGDLGEGDPWTDSSLLQNLPNLRLMGPRSYNELPAYLKGMDVALLPNRINEYTDAMFPMKFFEYLAAGRPVVSVNLKAIREFSGVVSIANSVQAFIEAVDRVLGGEAPPLEQRLALARAHTYAARTEKMLMMIEASCEGGDRSCAAIRT